MLFKDDKPPTSKEEAVERRVRPPPEKYDPDEHSHWSITMTLAWINWGEIDAVRNEWDDYRNGCADWVFENDPIARAQIGQIGPQKGSWHLHQWPPSGWNRLYLRTISKNILEPRQQAILPPQVAIDELWLTAGEGRIKATALECKNAKAFDGDRIEIPAHHWPHLKRVDDPLTGKAMLSDDNGRVYREVLFRRLDVKELWPKSACSPNVEPSVSEEKDKGGGRSDYEGSYEPLDRPILQEMEAATPKMRGRKKKGDGSYANIDRPLLDEMKQLISSHRAASPEEAARMLAKKAHGSGSEESKAERLAKRYRENASGPNSLGSGS